MQASKSYNTGREILFNFGSALTFPATIDGTSVKANTDGRKIIKAGTPLGAATSYLADRNTVLAPVTDATAQVITMHDVDVTSGKASDTVIVRGDVVKKNMDTDVQALFTADMIKALTQITLV
jgi:hypothetical protein